MLVDRGRELLKLLVALGLVKRHALDAAGARRRPRRLGSRLALWMVAHQRVERGVHGVEFAAARVQLASRVRHAERVHRVVESGSLLRLLLPRLLIQLAVGHRIQCEFLL